MDRTKIRWAESTWNPMTGCSKVSPGCEHCYAEAIATRFGAAFPNGFEPTFKPGKLGDPARWRAPRRVFVNSMSDLHHPDFGRTELDQVYDAMLRTPRHDYLVLTKRPQRMADYVLRWLDRRALTALPSHIWLGTSIESDTYAWRADHLRRIPVSVRFVSAEPLLGELARLDLSGLAWIIVGGESGPGYRPMALAWARGLRDRCAEAGIAYYFKQSAASRSEMGITLDGARHEEYPHPHPASGHARSLGRWTDQAPTR